MLTLLLGCVLSFPPMPETSASDIEPQPDPQLSALLMMNKSDFVGSGVLIAYEGSNYVLTARHVAQGLRRPIVCTSPAIECKSLDGILAEGVDEDHDWAIYAAPDGLGIPVTLDESIPQIGQNVMVVGAPRNIVGTHTWGRVSSIDTDRQHFNVTAFGYFGSSGAPVYDSDNKVLGIMIAIPQGIREDTLNELPQCYWSGAMDFIVP